MSNSIEVKLQVAKEIAQEVNRTGRSVYQISEKLNLLDEDGAIVTVAKLMVRGLIGEDREALEYLANPQDCNGCGHPVIFGFCYAPLSAAD